jgi:hypothetical protein
VRGRCWLDGDRSNLDAVGPIAFERPIGADDRARELAVPTADRQVATGLGHGKTDTLAGPSPRRERPFSWTGGTAVAGGQAAADDERCDERTCGPSFHCSVIALGANGIKPVILCRERLHR